MQYIDYNSCFYCFVQKRQRFQIPFDFGWIPYPSFGKVLQTQVKDRPQLEIWVQYRFCFSCLSKLVFVRTFEKNTFYNLSAPMFFISFISVLCVLTCQSLKHFFSYIINLKMNNLVPDCSHSRIYYIKFKYL